MKFAKRSLDLFASASGLVALAPLFAAVAVLIKLDDPGPVFFRQERVGLKGKMFRILKFRTMRVRQPAGSKLITVGADPRVTRIGHYLRKLKLDELPQLFNVIRGEMTLVGPRPEVPHYVALYNSDQRRVLDFYPGVTDPASIRFRSESDLLAQSSDPEATYVNEIMPEKIRLNLEYHESANFFTDVAILLRTLRVLSQT